MKHCLARVLMSVIPFYAAIFCCIAPQNAAAENSRYNSRGGVQVEGHLDADYCGHVVVPIAPPLWCAQRQGPLSFVPIYVVSYAKNKLKIVKIITTDANGDFALSLKPGIYGFHVDNLNSGWFPGGMSTPFEIINGSPVSIPPSDPHSGPVYLRLLAVRMADFAS